MASSKVGPTSNCALRVRPLLTASIFLGTLSAVHLVVPKLICTAYLTGPYRYSIRTNLDTCWVLAKLKTCSAVWLEALILLTAWRQPAWVVMEWPISDRPREANRLINSAFTCAQ